MNRKQAEKLAREITWKVCMLHEVPEQADFDALEAYGWRLQRLGMAGFDGIRVDDGGAGFFIAAPRRRNPGRKQTCTAYSMADIEAYGRVCDALMADDYAAAYAGIDAIGAASLKAEAMEGLERLEAEIGWEAADAALADHETRGGSTGAASAASDLECIREVMASIGEFEVTQKRPGCCVWVKGDTKPHKEELKALGMHWAPSKQAWYWKPEAA